MIYLLIVSIIWAFSFSLIKQYLTGLDPVLVSFIRLALSLLIFLPFLKIKTLSNDLKLKFFFIGMIQYGLMYICYIYSFQFLPAWQAALFTIFTPVYVTLINDVLQRRFHLLYLSTAAFSVLGTAVIIYADIFQTNFITGFLILQVSNLSFAFGQVYYRKIMLEQQQINDKNIFALLYAGAVFLTGFISIFTAAWAEINLGMSQILSLLYLGIIASGVCFFLWNFGAKKTNPGSLAVFNNIKIPLAVGVSLFLFREDADILRLLIGGLIITSSLFFNEKYVH